MHQSFFRPNYIFNNDAYFFRFLSTQKFPLIFFNVNLFFHQQALHSGVLNHEKKQHKEGTCKVSGRSAVFSLFILIFVFAPN